MIKCSVCGSSDARSMKHLPLPNGKSGWITLSNWTDYCMPCAKIAGNKANELFENAKESVKNG